MEKGHKIYPMFNLLHFYRKELEMSDYEKAKDQYANDESGFKDGMSCDNRTYTLRQGIKIGADWSKSYFEKIIEEKDKEIEALKRHPTPKMATAMMLDVKKSFESKLSERDATIEKLKEALQNLRTGALNVVEANEIECRNDDDCDHCFYEQCDVEAALLLTSLISPQSTEKGGKDETN